MVRTKRNNSNCSLNPPGLLENGQLTSQLALEHISIPTLSTNTHKQKHMKRLINEQEHLIKQ